MWSAQIDLDGETFLGHEKILEDSDHHGKVGRERPRRGLLERRHQPRQFSGRALRRRPFIEFADDNTFVDHAWGRQLCRALMPTGVKWFTETDISVADDLELLRLMQESRCRQVLIGLESPEERSLRGIELRTDFKRRRSGGCLEAEGRSAGTHQRVDRLPCVFRGEQFGVPRARRAAVDGNGCDHRPFAEKHRDAGFRAGV